jgi:hypothetical protein
MKRVSLLRNQLALAVGFKGGREMQNVLGLREAVVGVHSIARVK